MKPKTEVQVPRKTSKQSEEKDGLHVRGNFSLSVGVQIFGLENQSRREKVFKLVILASLIILLLAILIFTNNENISLSVTKIIEKVLFILQTAVSSGEIITKVIKKLQTSK